MLECCSVVCHLCISPDVAAHTFNTFRVQLRAPFYARGNIETSPATSKFWHKDAPTSDLTGDLGMFFVRSLWKACPPPPSPDEAPEMRF